MPNEDKILVSHLKQGNPKAFEQLFLKYQKKLYYFCRKIIKNKEDSENLVQNTFLEIWENRQNIDEEKSFSGYLFKAIKNKVYNYIKKKINEQFYLDFINEDSEEYSEDQYETKQLVDIVNELIQKLPERRKEIFLLSRNEGLTYKEIASKLNITENTVDTQIRKTLDFLRFEYQKYTNKF